MRLMLQARKMPKELEQSEISHLLFSPFAILQLSATQILELHSLSRETASYKGK